MAAWEKIADIELTSLNNPNVISNLNITKDDFYMLNTTRIGNGVSEIYVNNNTNDSNYVNQETGTNISNLVPQRKNEPIFNYSDINTSTPSSTFGFIKLTETGHFVNFSNWLFENGSQVQFRNSNTSSLFTMSNINQIEIGGAGYANSRYQLYKLTAEKLADITVLSNTTQILIDNLNINSSNQLLLISDINNVSGTTSTYGLGVNGNTNESNYVVQRIFSGGNSISANEYNNLRYTITFNQDRTLAYTFLRLTNNGAFVTESFSLCNYGANDAFTKMNAMGTTFSGISEINSLTLTTNTTNAISAGSRYQLYKLY